MSTNNGNAARPDEAVRQDEVLMPAVDVFEDEGGITLYADLPGVPRDRLSLHVESDTLTIEGQMSPELAGGGEATHVEVAVPRYRRAFTLSPRESIASGPGPIHTSPASMTFCAKGPFSARKP